MIGVFGGTFDPIHFGHLRPALDVVDVFNMEKCHFIPCNIPHHRTQPSATSNQRLEMVAAAIAVESRFFADPVEIKRDGISYTIETLEVIRSEAGKSKTLCLIIGIDAFTKFDEWYRWDEILNLCHIIVTHRPGWEVENIVKSDLVSIELGNVITRCLITDKVELNKAKVGKIIFQSVTQLDISATKIRNLLAEKKSIHYLVPDDVIAVIKNQNIYVK